MAALNSGIRYVLEQFNIMVQTELSAASNNNLIEITLFNRIK